MSSAILARTSSENSCVSCKTWFVGPARWKVTFAIVVTTYKPVFDNKFFIPNMYHLNKVSCSVAGKHTEKSAGRGAVNGHEKIHGKGVCSLGANVGVDDSALGCPFTVFLNTSRGLDKLNSPQTSRENFTVKFQSSKTKRLPTFVVLDLS